MHYSNNMVCHTQHELIAGNIKQLRRFLGYSQQNMADMLYMSRSAYSNIENGITPLRVTMLSELSRVLGVSVEIFLMEDLSRLISK